MKKLYLLALGLATAFATAQTFSFETAEGYTPGSIHNQNGWEVTLNSDNQPIQNQVISAERASEGAQSLKIDVDEMEDFGWFPIYGAAKLFDTPVAFNGATVEMDVYITELDGSNFEFGTFGITGDEFVPVAVYSFNYTGMLEVVSSADYDYATTPFTWEANRWYKLKTEIDAAEIRYYIDGALIFTGTNFSQTDLRGLTLVHDNFSGAAYIDNIKITNMTMAVNAVTAGKVAVYPNPTADLVTVKAPAGEKVTSAEVYSAAGEKVLSQPGSTVSLKGLPAGVYLIKTKTSTGKTYNSRVIRK